MDALYQARVKLAKTKFTNLIFYKNVDYDKHLVDDCTWRIDGHFYIRVNYMYLYEFMNELKEILGEGIFDEGDTYAVLMQDHVCINLSKLIENVQDFTLEEIEEFWKIRYIGGEFE